MRCFTIFGSGKRRRGKRRKSTASSPTTPTTGNSGSGRMPSSSTHHPRAKESRAISHEFETDPTLFYRIIHPEDLARVNEHMSCRKYEPGLAEIEFRIIRRDGAERWVALAFQPVYDGSSRFLGTRGSNRDVTERKRAEAEREKLIGELRDALSRVKLLSGLLPICASCKKIRDDKGYWNQIESYIRDHSEAHFSHGICPECARKEYPELFAETVKRKTGK